MENMVFHCPVCQKTKNFKSLVPYQKALARGKCALCCYGNKAIREFHCPKCNETTTFISELPYLKTVERGCCRKCSQKGERTCPRCNTTIEYISRDALRKNADALDCKMCRHIPDASLEAFKQGRYVTHCTECGGEQEYCSRQGLLHALISKPACHSCASKRIAPLVKEKIKKQRAKLTPEQKKAIAKKLSERGKKAWASLSEQEKARRIKLLEGYRIDWLANLTVEKKDEWLANLRASFAKYRGENHWMNRVETMAKVHASYMKYLGPNHWRKRPGVHEKIMATLKHKKEMREVGIKI